jgi:phenylacetate-CoA ligase
MIPPLPESLVRNIVYPLYRGFRKDRVLDILDELEHNQFLPEGEIEDLKWRKLSVLLEAAGSHVPYYRDLFEREGIDPASFESPADMVAIPFLTKEIIRSEKRKMISKDPLRRGYPSSTGGSTGEPLHFWCDTAAGPVRRATTMRGYRWTGFDIGGRQAMLWGFHLDRPLKERLSEGVKNFFNNIMTLSSFDMTPEMMRRYAVRLRRFRPSIVIGYPSALTAFSEFCRGAGVRLPSLKAVVTGGERLFPHQRDLIEEAFHADVFDRYGSREFSAVAHECSEHKGLHVFNDLFHVEVIHESGRAAQSGEIGELVITDLSNLYMPFIRYRTGDLAMPTERKCPCGRGLPLLERIEGRSFDSIVTPEGKKVGGFFWTWLSRAVPGIDRFQIEQRDRAGIIFRIVPGEGWRDDHMEVLAGKIRENCCENFRIDFQVVDDIPLTPAGKAKFIISNIEERLVIKSKIHKAHISGDAPEENDCLQIDAKLLELGNVAVFEKILIVNATSGARLETFALEAESGSGDIIACGAVSRLCRPGDEISVMAFTWSTGEPGDFSNILVDEENRFVRYLTEKAGDRI